MCAIFGILGEYEQAQARFALATLQHRGPDYCGIVEQEKLFFAHQRLSILDREHRSHQPLRHKNILLSFNGEIYNFEALKKELHYDFVSHGDTEVIIAAYLQWGVDFVSHLRGMFAIALLDGDKLYLFRDRLGKKPLFFMHDNEAFRFASEIKALRPFLKQKKINQDGLMSYLSFLTPTPPHTFYEGIYKLGAGEYLCFSNHKYTIKRYFDLLEVPSCSITTQNEAIQKITDTLEESIALRLQSDLPIASLLSGGIDSATLNYYAKYFNKPLHTYTIGYKGYAKYDERLNAQATAQQLQIDHTTLEIDERMFLEGSQKVFATMDEPLNDPAAVPLYLLFEKIAQDGYRVVLSGEGSDELFLGYRQYFEYLDIEQAQNLAHKNWLKKYFRAHFSMNREWEWYKRVFDDTLLFRTSGDKFTDLQKNALMRRNVKDNSSLVYLHNYQERFEHSHHNDPSIWYTYIDLHIFQAEHFLAKLDRVSMAHSIESRTPFLDHKLASLLFTIDPKLRYEEGITKSLLKKVMHNKLSDTILQRKKKGFANPYMEYLLNSKKINLIQEVNKETGMFHKEKLDEYIARGVNGSFKQHIWGLYVLSYWIKKEFLC
jgi:asparagine synthase (glutamine-hydrolysing)